MADIIRMSPTLPSPPKAYDEKDQRELRRLLMESLGRPTQDTMALQVRARVTATGATTVTVRVAVVDPFPQGADSASIAHSYVIGSGAGTVDLSSPQTVTPESTFTEAAGTYKDYVVTRPTVASGSGRITFTATATNRVGASDAVDVPAAESVYTECRAAVTAADATTVTVTVTASAPTGTPTVHLVAITGSATLSSGPAVGATGQASGTSWVFNRGAALGGIGQVQFRATLSGATTDDDFVDIAEVGQDTIYLVARARVTATTTTTVTVRVAVADPYPQGANSVTVSYSELGLGAATSPASGGTLTPAATLTEAAGTYIDYTVTRPAVSDGTGRITFTASASGRVTDSDAVDVPAALSTPAWLDVRPVVSTDYYHIYWTGSPSVVVSIDGAAYATPGTSPIAVARNAAGGVKKMYTFRAGPGSQGDYASHTVSVEPKEATPPTDPIFTDCYCSGGTEPGDGGGSVEITFGTENEPVGWTVDIALTNIECDSGLFDTSDTETGFTASPATLTLQLGPGARFDVLMTLRDSGAVELDTRFFHVAALPA